MKVYVIVAHPDDEIIGVGGTIAKHIQEDDEVRVMIVAEGKSSRLEHYENFSAKNNLKYESETKEALSILGVTKIKMLNMPNNRLDRLDLLDIIKVISKEVEEFMPNRIYTHYYNDLNIDHQIVSRAVVTANRPVPTTEVRDILFFETLSSTEYSLGMRNAFCPNYFVNIEKQLKIKIEALSKYESELREFPNPRNLDSVKENAIIWGNKVGIAAAEAFEISRMVW